jgi:hypothetical protein
MSKARNLSKLLSEGNVSSFGSLATKNTVSATEIATGAIEGKLGYTPAPTNNPTLTGNITLAGSSQQIVFDRTLGDNWIGSSIAIENGNISIFEPPTNLYNWLSSLQAGDKFTIQPGGQEVTVASTTNSTYLFLITPEEPIDETPGESALPSTFWITSFTQTIIGSPNLLLGSTPIGDLATKDSISTTEIDDGAVTNAKIAAMAASKLTGQVPSANAPSGSVSQVVQHKTTARSTLSVAGSSVISATSGAQYTTFAFTPTFSNSKLLLLSSVFFIGERANVADALYASAIHSGTTIIGSVLNYSGYQNWSSNGDGTFVSFNHLFDSWGTSTQQISIRVGMVSNGTVAVNYPNNSDINYVNQYDSPNRHEVTFTVLEISA